MAEPTIIYKVAVLELLNRSGFPLTNSQLSNFFLEGDLTDYFTVQQAISDDESAGLISSVSGHNSTTYTITGEGRHTLELLGDKLTPALRADIANYLRQNSMSMQEENSYRATYFAASKGGYVVQLKIMEDKTTLMDLSLHVATREMAETLCNNWRVRSGDVYDSIMDILVN